MDILKFDCIVCKHPVWVEDDWDTCTQVCTDCGAEHGVQLEVKSVWLEEYKNKKGKANNEKD